MKFELQDALELRPLRKTKEGYLVGEVRAARTGIQVYHGSEFGPAAPQKLLRVWRPEDEVFDDTALGSLTNKPVTIGHPPKGVNATNWKKHAVGNTGETSQAIGKFVHVPLVLQDADAIGEVESGIVKELSYGYTCDIEFTPGKTPEGEEYDAVQKHIRGNHLAIVKSGRAGSECRIGDEDNKMTLKTITVDGIPVEVTDAGAMVIKTLQDRNGQLTADNLKMVADHQAALAAKDAEVKAAVSAKDTELGKQAAEIADLKTKVLDDAAIEKRVKDRAEVIGKAKAILGKDIDFTGKSVEEVRRLTVATKLGDEAVKDRSDDYVLALFEHSGSGTKPAASGAPVRDALSESLRGGSSPQGQGSADEAWSKMVADMSNQWQDPNGSQQRAN
jgi:hypothetical protein